MIEFEVPGMTCGACANRIARALSGVGQDDSRVEIDVAARRVRLDAPEGGDIEAYRSAIESAGYSAKPVATSSPARRAGGCCCATRATASIDMRQGTRPRKGGCCG